MKNRLAESIHMEFNDNSVLSSLFGVSDSNIQLLEKINNVKIEYRGNVVKISGNKLSIQETKLSLEKLFDEAKKGIEIDEEKILLKKYGSKDSGASLGDILNDALKNNKSS